MSRLTKYKIAKVISIGAPTLFSVFTVGFPATCAIMFMIMGNDLFNHFYDMMELEKSLIRLKNLAAKLGIKE